ncbi:phosphatase PAP2 family protein [Nakamurella flava]|uniref:phosphatase PAP2 family protein n=1 Tax=Nakamurella flava TaxID=2576308 RepID=UPI00140C64E1|nr:phosphatase PAP2 family protein [Nakamurella flava]
MLSTALIGATGATGAESTTSSSATTTTSPSTDPADTPAPEAVPILSGFSDFWNLAASGPTPVLNPTVLQHNDEIVVWINNHATPAQQFTALQTAVFDGASPDSYDQSITLAPALGSVLAPLYVTGRQSGALPLTTALVNAKTGTAGNYIDVGTPKNYFDGLRPYWPTDDSTPPADNACPAGFPSGDYMGPIRDGQPYADSNGNLLIDQLADTSDTTGQYTSSSVTLSGGYAGLCGNPPSQYPDGPSYSFPSGHTTSAYQSAITLATLLPELGPELLARASEHGNNRLVVGVHSPLDVIGGRMLGEASIAARWSQPDYVTSSLAPAAVELRTYLETQCGGTITACLARGSAYQDNPYAGQVMPGGTAQIVTDRKSAVATYRERMTYSFAPSGTTGLPMTVPPGAENLLLTTYPTLTAAQRQAVLAQTSIDSGYPLDLTDQGDAAWQRIDLAAAMSAKVQINADGSVTVLSVGGAAEVVTAPPTTTSTPTTTTTTTPTTTITPATITLDPITIAPITFTAPQPIIVNVPTTFTYSPVVVATGPAVVVTGTTGTTLAATGASVGAPLALGTVAIGTGLLLITAVAARRRPRHR